MITLLLVDIQNDFLPGGALAVPNGDEVVAVANHAMDLAAHVVATQDWHPADHGSFASQHDGIEFGESFHLDGLPQIAWPDHCVEGSRGAEFAEQLNVNRIEFIARKGTDKQVDSYSGFFDNGERRATCLNSYLLSIGSKEILVMGLATDYCVKFTVLDALRLGYRTHVALDGCRGVDLIPGDTERAICEMRLAGAHIVDSFSEVLKRPI